jgi:hypothetical protein
MACIGVTEEEWREKCDEVARLESLVEATVERAEKAEAEAQRLRVQIRFCAPSWSFQP